MKKLKFKNINLKFDKNLNPILSKKNDIDDYNFMKSIFTDIKVMKTSSMFACGLPKNKTELHLLMKSFVDCNKKYRNQYGLKIIFDTTKKCNIGVAGIVKCINKIPEYNNDVVEGFVFLAPNYQNLRYGFYIYKAIADKAEKNNQIIVSSEWSGNIPSKRLIEKYGGCFCGKSTKTLHNHSIEVDEYIKYPSQLLKNNNVKVKSYNLKDLFLTYQIKDITKVNQNKRFMRYTATF